MSAGVNANADAEAYRINLLRMDWRWRKQKLMCDVGFDSAYNRIVFDTGERRYKPLRWTTQNTDKVISTTFTCSDPMWRAYWDNDVWVSRATSFTFGKFFSIYGVTLDSKQTRTENHKITYRIRGKFSRARGCGNGNDPYKAAWVREYQM